MSEATPLLDNAREPHRGWKERFRFSPQTLVIPVAVASRLGYSLPSTTFIDLLRRAICELWNITHGNEATLQTGGLTPQICDTAEVTQYYAAIIAILGVIENISSIAMVGIISRILFRNRRKPVLLYVLLIRIIGSFLVPASQYVPDWLSGRLFVFGMLFDLFCGLLPYAYIINVYVLDVCTSENRTAALSRIAGWSSLGTCISLATGGLITTKTGNPFIVFYAATAIFIAAFFYILFVLPESLPEGNPNELSRVTRELPDDGPQKPSLLGPVLIIFEPLKMLIPTHNWRLTWCGIHAFVFMIFHSYNSTAWKVLVTAKHHLTPADTGLFFTSMTTSSTILLTLIIPWLVRSLHPYYRRRVTRPLAMQRDTSTGQEPEYETSDRLDVHLAFFSCVIAGLFYLNAAAFTTSRALVFSGIWLGFISVHHPTTRSLVAGSVEPLKQGEALAAMEMVSHVGSVLSSIIMGTILAKTIETTPLLVFYIHLVAVVLSGALLFFVRDADRYQKPTEE